MQRGMFSNTPHLVGTIMVNSRFIQVHLPEGIRNTGVPSHLLMAMRLCYVPCQPMVNIYWLQLIMVVIRDTKCIKIPVPNTRTILRTHL